METTWYNNWWKPNAEQRPYTENTKKLLFAFEYSKKTHKILFTVHAESEELLIFFFIDLPQCQIWKMIKLQKFGVSFTMLKLPSIEDGVSLKWLPVP